MTAFEQVAAYAAGMLDAAAIDDVEQRLFEDANFAEAAALVLAIIDGLGELSRSGPVLPIITPAQLRDLSASGRNVLECYPEAGTLVATVTPDIELVAARLPVDLRDAVRIDVAIGTLDGPPYFVTREAPFDPTTGEIVLLCRSHVALRAGRIRITITDERDRSRGEFILDSRSLEHGQAE